ncbi:hypothetical protein D3C72_2469910 [compost metagenome]
MEIKYKQVVGAQGTFNEFWRKRFMPEIWPVLRHAEVHVVHVVNGHFPDSPGVPVRPNSCLEQR